MQLDVKSGQPDDASYKQFCNASNEISIREALADVIQAEKISAKGKNKVPVMQAVEEALIDVDMESYLDMLLAGSFGKQPASERWWKMNPATKVWQGVMLWSSKWGKSWSTTRGNLMKRAFWNMLLSVRWENSESLNPKWTTTYRQNQHAMDLNQIQATRRRSAIQVLVDVI